jgi:hypothetical protein
MRVVLSAVFGLVLSAVASAPSLAVQPGFSDTICPEGTQYVLAVGKLRVDDPPQRIYDAAHAASEAYARCSSQKLAYGFREAQHYADVRSAQFGVVAARALVALGRLDEARSLLQHDRALAQNVADWITDPTAFNSADVNGSAVATGSDKRPSMYRESAKDIVTAADEALAEIGRLTNDVSRRQGVHPAPAATPGH